jgi:hypothetical protein
MGLTDGAVRKTIILRDLQRGEACDFCARNCRDYSSLRIAFGAVRKRL